MGVRIEVPSTDIDGDIIVYLFEWYESKDGVNWIRRPELSGNLSPFFPGEPEISSLYTQLTQVAETWRVDVTPIEAYTVSKKGEPARKGAPIAGEKGTAQVTILANLASGSGTSDNIFNGPDLVAFLSLWHQTKGDLPPDLRNLFFDSGDSDSTQIGTHQLFPLCTLGWYQELGSPRK